MAVSTLILEGLILLLLLYLAFFKSYFQEKGKNVATKEDVGEITKLVESVKSQLAFSLQAKLSLRAEEHEALIDYFSKYSAWLSAITGFSIVGLDKDNAASRLAEIRFQLDVLHKDFDLATGRMELFVENEDIQSQHRALALKTLEFQGHAQQLTFDVEKIYLDVKHMLLQAPPEEQAKRYAEFLKTVRDTYKKFKDEQMEAYKALFPVVQKHRRAISKHIRALADG